MKSKYNPSFTSQVSLFDMALCTKIKGVFIIQSFTNYVPENSAARMCSMKKGGLLSKKVAAYQTHRLHSVLANTCYTSRRKMVIPSHMHWKGFSHWMKGLTWIYDLYSLHHWYIYEEDRVIPSCSQYPSPIWNLTEKQGKVSILRVIHPQSSRVSPGSHPVRRVCQLVMILRDGPGLSTPNIIHLVLINGNRRIHPSISKGSADFRWKRIRSQGGPHLLFPRHLGNWPSFVYTWYKPFGSVK